MNYDDSVFGQMENYHDPHCAVVAVGKGDIPPRGQEKNMVMRTIYWIVCR